MQTRRINEALGVPDNIYETSLKLFDKFYNWTKSLRKKDFKKGVGAKKILRGDFRVGDYEFSNIKFQLGVEKFEQLEEPSLVSMVNRSSSKKTEDFKLQSIKKKSVDLLVIIGIPEDYSYRNISEFVLAQKNEIVENFSHELKHAYDHFKMPYDNRKIRSEYQAVLSLSSGIPAVDQFLHDIYFTSVNESLVRPSEIAAAIKNNQISQKDFLNFLNSNETYRILKRISNFNYETFKREILQDKKALNSFLKNIGLRPTSLTDEQKLQEALKSVQQAITSSKIEQFGEILTQSFYEQLFGFEGEKLKIFEKFSKQNMKFKTPDDFFRFYQNRFHLVGREMMKKLAKLYDITRKQNPQQ